MTAAGGEGDVPPNRMRVPTWLRNCRRTVAERPGASFAVTSFLLMAAWGLLVPLFAGPDENSNWVHAAAIARGEFVGDDFEPTLHLSYYRTLPDIDPRLGAANFIPFCFAPHAHIPACDVSLESVDVGDTPVHTNQGRYPPAALVAPGVATYLGVSDLSAHATRLVDAATTAGLLGLAAAGLARAARPVPLTILLVAWTPGSQFMGAVLNPSGVEIAAAIAVWVLLPIALDTGRGSWMRSDDIALAAAAVALIAARQVGAVLLVLIGFCCLIATAGAHPVAELWKRAPIALASSAVAALAMGGWYLAVFGEHLGTSVADGEPTIGRLAVVERALGDLPKVVAEHVGNYGWLDTPSPSLTVWFFLVVTAAVVVVTWDRMTRRERLAVVAVGAIVVVLQVYLSINFYRLLRVFGVQGRHLSPLIVGIPLLVAHRWHPSTLVRRMIAWSWVGAVVLAGVYAVRRYAVGVTAGNFLDTFTDPVWSPPPGVVPTMILFVAATSLVAWVCTVAPGSAVDAPIVAPAPEGASPGARSSPPLRPDRAG